MLRRAASAAVLIGALLCAPTTAWAEDDPSVFFVVSTGVVLAADLGFLLADLGFGVEGEWLPRYGAWTQLVLMTAANYVLGIYTLDQMSDAPLVALGVGELVIGTWFAVHGILSILGQPDEPPPPQPSVVVTPLREGGAALAFTTSF